MARKQKHKIDKKMIIDAFAEMAKEKNIDKDLLQGILEETLSLLIKKKYGNKSNFEIIVNMNKGDLEIYLIKEVVEIVEEQETEISLEEANIYSIEPLKIGDDFIEEITLDNIADSFGRRLISFASQMMNQKIREVERDNIFEEYSRQIGDLVFGEVYQNRRNMILVAHGKIELKLLKEDQIPNDYNILRKSGTVKAVIKDVVRNPNGGLPDVYLSRTSNEFVKRLFELEIPEINDGIIQIKDIARDPGERMKISLVSADDRIDPIGACVGLKGIRINAIVRELGNESIDLIPWAAEPEKMIEKAISPAKVKEVTVSQETKTATVLVAEDQVQFAIGKNGQNIRLASMLTGYNLKLLKEGGEDIEIHEFELELGTELIGKLQQENINTAKEFLDATPQTLMNLGMDYNSIIENRRVILLEFEEEENSDYISQLNSIFGFDLQSNNEENNENNEKNETESNEIETISGTTVEN